LASRRFEQDARLIVDRRVGAYRHPFARVTPEFFEVVRKITQRAPRRVRGQSQAALRGDVAVVYFF
jgi:hypothetical protein